MAQSSPILNTSQILLEKRRYTVHEALDPRIGALTRDSLVFDEWQEHSAYRLVRQLSAYVLSEKLVDKTVSDRRTLSVDIPASWWQHFKLDVLASFNVGRWFVMKRPVRYRTEKREHTFRADFRQWATFPAADVMTPPDVHHYLVVPKEELTYS